MLRASRNQWRRQVRGDQQYPRFLPCDRRQGLFNGCDVHVDPKRACRLLGVSNQQEEMLDRDSNVLDRRVRYAAYFAEYFARLMQLPGFGTRALAVDVGDFTDSRPLGSGPVSINYLFWPHGGSLPSGSLHSSRSLGDWCTETSAWVLLRATHRQGDA